MPRSRAWAVRRRAAPNLVLVANFGAGAGLDLSNPRGVLIDSGQLDLGVAVTDRGVAAGMQSLMR
jgi:hypothetical protein